MKRGRDITDPLLWWRTLGISLFPKMAGWVRDTFAVSATSCGVEREFSIAGRVVTKQRNSLKAETISAIMQYKRWCDRRGHKVEEMEATVEGGDEDSECDSEFDERNAELELWLADWSESNELRSAAQNVFTM